MHRYQLCILAYDHYANYRFVKIVRMLCCKVCNYAVIYSTAIIPPPKQRLNKVQNISPPILLAFPRKGSALVVGPGTDTDVADSLIALLDITGELLTTTGDVEICSDVGGGGATEEGSGAGAVDASWLGGGGEGEVSNVGGGGATEEGS